MQPNLSVFKNALTNQPYEVQATPVVLVQRIASTKYQPQTEHLRALPDAEAKATYKKTGFVAVTWSGEFGPTRAKANLQTHSGLICTDFDKLPPERLTALRKQLVTDEFTHVLFISPSGNGLKCVVKIDCPTGDAHEAFFRQLSDYYRDCYGVTETELDASGKNVDRLCFLPHDPNVYYNADSSIMPLADEYAVPVSKQQAPPVESERTRSNKHGLDRADVGDWVSQIEAAPAGKRNEVLCKFAYLAGGYIAGGLVDESAVISALEGAVWTWQDDKSYESDCRKIRKQIEAGKTQPITDAADYRSTYQHSHHTTHPQEWPQPVPLKPELPTVPKLESDMLPEPLRPWLADIAHRMKCPLDFTASAAVVMLSSLVGTRLAIKPKANDDWTIVPNLWGAVIGEPSALKTPSVAEVLKPLNRLITESMEDHEQQQLRYQAGQITYEAQKKVYLSQEQDRLKGKIVSNAVDYPEAPEKPTERRYMTSDATVEKLGELLNENPNGLLQFRDELTGLLAGWDRAGHEQDRAFYLEAWNGNGGTSIDRIGRGTMHIKNVCVSLLGGIQPAKLLGYLQAATGYENDGFVQRLQLAVFPDRANWSYTDDVPDKPARDRAFTLIRKIADMDLGEIGYAADEYNRFPYTRFAPEAQAIFREWLTAWETVVLPAEQGLLLEHFTKYRSLMPSLALIFHVVNCADSDSEPKGVSVEAAAMAVRWCDYLMSHARRIYGLLDTVSIEGATRILTEIRRGKLSDGFKVRDIVRMGWSHLKTTEQVETAIGELIARYCLRESTSDAPGTGRPESPTYAIHPSFLPNA
ncbi:DUF3987 domain-containing protein [Fibrella sp. HMF5335]|uniref:DUF3987 domain-containing protein n=1 Tax=Fibrella rubiginis TaxID=2817060 RepID=A0A939K7Z6_9BACT|nr:DUF3987 domain-containing protein [Fibrella rubiginis]MBO0939956.1 DUF3987 domain-containing protein [Fibrella rubiginis]